MFRVVLCTTAVYYHKHTHISSVCLNITRELALLVKVVYNMRLNYLQFLWRF